MPAKAPALSKLTTVFFLFSYDIFLKDPRAFYNALHDLGADIYLMKYYVYIIYSERSDLFYIGQTYNFDVRFEQHNSKKSDFTSKHSPWTPILVLEKNNRKSAMELENKLKNLNRDRLLKFIEKYS